ncbi:MAG: glutathione S-transferase family protein [Proteobacteria bacterium]|nr:glutathione S-transferase family protein [Pseudomonadota bacterium]
MQKHSAIQFWGAGTMRTFRPLWAAEEMGLQYTLHPIGPRTGETQTNEYTQLNPKQKVPYMQDGAFGLSESVAISRYLIQRYGSDQTLSPMQSLESSAKEDEWVAYVYGELDETSLYVMRRHGDLAHIYGESPAAMVAAKAYAQKHLAVCAEYLQDKDFLLNQRLGLADIMLVSCLDWAVHYQFELPESLQCYRQLHRQRAAYRRAYAVNYPKTL